MNIYVKEIEEIHCYCDALILPYIEKSPDLYKNLGSGVSKLIRKLFLKEFQGKQNDIILIPAPEDIKPQRLMLVGLGKSEELTGEILRRAGGMTAAYLRDKGMKNIALSSQVLSSLRVSPIDFIEGALLGDYSFKKYMTEKDHKNIESLTLLSKDIKNLEDEIKQVKIITSSVHFARDLINTPSNEMTPSHLAKFALSIKKNNLKVRILEKKDVKKLGMNAFLAVAKGSKEPLKFIVLEYKTSKASPIILIGKSITFDSGGLSLKSADAMEKMKYDMAGGAAVLGIMKAISELKMKVNLIGILPATENLPGDSATKPGDIVRAIDGKTIEIVNTDAEGRLTLADAIGYAKRFKPRAIIDIATLTGACSIAFGNEAIAMMGNDRKLLDIIKRAADKTYERVWEMPLFKEYKEYIKSEIADLKNSGGKNGSLVTSAYFLYEFVGNTPWVHLDIAGTAWNDKDKPYAPKGATGIGIRLILNLIKELK